MKRQQLKLHQYKQVLEAYHGTLDLTSREALKHLGVKISDSLIYADMLKSRIGDLDKGATILDVGSGAGLPGIPIAIALPYCAVHLVERRGKRATMLRIIKGKLALDNITIHAADVTRLDGIEAPFITALAVSSFTDLYCLTRHLHAEDVVIMSRKGIEWPGEVGDLQKTISASSKPPPAIKPSTLPLSNDGTLVAIRLTGGLSCQS